MATSAPTPLPALAPPLLGRAATPSASAVGATDTRRLAFIDNMRILMIIMVIAHHAGQPYGPTGGFWPINDARHAPLLGPFFTVNASFGMGLFFLISAAFLPASYDRKGPRAFLRDRLRRIGLPFLIGTLVFFIPAFSVIEGPFTGGPLAFLRDFLVSYFGPWHFGHLWFLAHLLVAMTAYALWRRLVPRSAAGGGRSAPLPGTGAILGFIAALGLATFVVRIRFPIDYWTPLPLLVPVEYAHLPQYASLFVVGLVAGHSGWFRRIPTRLGLLWLAVGLATAALAYAHSLVAPWLGTNWFTSGGANWNSLAQSLWEAALCTSLAIGLPVLFREVADRQGPFLKSLAADSYTVYVIHIAVLLTMQAALANAALPPLVKFILVALVGVPLCFLLAAGLRRLSGMPRRHSRQKTAGANSPGRQEVRR
ncbi:MAG: acyltransferase [Thermomicrobiales bacterium]